MKDEIINIVIELLNHYDEPSFRRIYQENGDSHKDIVDRWFGPGMFGPQFELTVTKVKKEAFEAGRTYYVDEFREDERIIDGASNQKYLSTQDYLNQTNDERQNKH